MNPDFWRDRRVFITGHTGFKGSWLCMLLHRVGANVAGYALDPPTQPSLFALARVHELKKQPHAQQVAWSRATVAFASFQALAGIIYSMIFNASGGHYQTLFMVACGALLLAIGLDFIRPANGRLPAAAR